MSRRRRLGATIALALVSVSSVSVIGAGWSVAPLQDRSIEPLAAPTPSPTETALGEGRRVETPSGLVITFPQGWTISGPDSADEQTVIPSIRDLLARRLEPLVAPLLPSPTMSAVRHAPDDGDEPSESCTVGAVPGWLYDEPLEQVVALMLGAQLEDEETPPVTYLSLPVGRVARADVNEGAVRESTYLVPTGLRLHLLVCRGPEGATTGWDAIASSIELVIAD